MSANSGLALAIPGRHLFAKTLGGSGRFAPNKMAPVEIIWWCFVACVVLGNINEYYVGEAGPLFYLLSFCGSAGCAWAWLFTRALFRPEASMARWPFYLLGATVLFEGAWEITNGLATTGEVRRIIANGASFLCISLLAATFVEALSGYDRDSSLKERRFRQIYVGAFGLILGITMFWALGAPEGSLAAQTDLPMRLAFAALAIVGGRFAIDFRKKHPLSNTKTSSRRHSQPAVIDAESANLARRIRAALEKDQFFATPQLKISDLSAALGEPDYKVTQCITSAMGHANFNRLVNAYRIAAAKAALANSDNDDRQILAIALDCGFNSIGPFNRAFKREVGMTPRAFRALVSDERSAPIRHAAE